MMGISRYAVYTYENGKAFPTVEGLLALADYFDVSTDYLLGRTDVREVARSNSEGGTP